MKIEIRSPLNITRTPKAQATIICPPMSPELSRFKRFKNGLKKDVEEVLRNAADKVGGKS